MPPLPADSIHARACKLKCEKILTRPFACGENACTAQRRRRPEGRSFRVVNIQIDLALHKKPWNFNGSRVFLFALNCKILVHCRPGGVLNLIFCISANHIFDAIACQKFILDVCHLCNKEPGISKRGDVILHSPFIMWKKFKHEYFSSLCPNIYKEEFSCRKL